MRAHVFDQPQHRHADFFKHLQPFFGIEQGDVLRRGNNHRAGHRDFLRQGELHIARPWRHINQQIVQRVPAGIVEELHQGLGDHRAAPHHRLILLDQIAHRHGLHAQPCHRHQRFAFWRIGSHPLCPH